MVRFIHAADIHLDSPLLGLTRYEGAPVEQLRTATRSALANLADLALREQVDFMIIAGDLYDGDWRDYRTGLYFCRQMARLNEAGIPVFIAYGNHDAKSEITRELPLPANVREFPASAPKTWRLDHLDVALHGQSYRTAATVENLAAGYPPAVPGCLNIGVLHTALDGHADHDPYAPCALDELLSRGYDYWALGHVHQYAVRHEDPWIVYPGNLQGRHIREQGERGAVLVTATGSRLSVERCFVDVLRWYHLYVDVSPCSGMDDVIERVGRSLEPLVRQQADGRFIAVRVTLRGRTRAHGQLFGLETHLRQGVLAYASELAGDAIWVEKVCLGTSPALTPEELMARSDALADLQDLLAEAVAHPQLLDQLGDTLRELVNRCPRELFAYAPSLEAIREGRIASLIEEVAPSLLARLASEP